MRIHLARDLEKLKLGILEMGAMVEEAIKMAIDAMVNRRVDIAEIVIDGDDIIDAKELDIEDACLKVLALHQPVAIDLRYVISILKSNNNLEQMGDLAGHVAKRALFLASQPPIGLPAKFDEMVERVKAMVGKSLDSLIRQDAELAQETVMMDDRVDELHWEMYYELLGRMREEPDIINRAYHTISAVRQIERIADLATNIAEDVYFTVKGSVIRHQIEKGHTEDN
ncbi:MAG TPA: phosphate signaling complex protein PhoU [Firmicutes bacterium]|mgnify:CR=1 FL=1|nr:phosphate signaling complex protein PhoU [Bacillota bacterium]